MSILPINPIIRFLSKITIKDNGCWEWISSLNVDGYGKFYDGKIKYAHRFIYEYFYGQICPDLTIDHLCRNRACVNPVHMELVTIQENIKRGISQSVINSQKTHCQNEHPLFGKNLYVAPNGTRHCRKCRYVFNLQYKKVKNLRR